METLISLSEAARLLNICPKTLRKREKDARFAAIFCRIGEGRGMLKIRPSALEEFVANGGIMQHVSNDMPRETAGRRSRKKTAAAPKSSDMKDILRELYPGIIT